MVLTYLILQRQQDERHIPFTQQISALNPLLPVACIRTA